MKRKIIGIAAAFFILLGAGLLIIPRVSNYIGVQIAHTTVNDEDIPCPHCQNMTDKGDYEFGADFPIVEYDDLFYIRKEKSTNRFDLVFEGKVNNSCRIYFCPICGRELR